jgi:hypothetical protein
MRPTPKRCYAGEILALRAQPIPDRVYKVYRQAARDKLKILRRGFSRHVHPLSGVSIITPILRDMGLCGRIFPG